MRTTLVGATVLLGLALAPGADARQNKDVFLDSAVHRQVPAAQQRALQGVSRPGTRVQFEHRLGVPTVIWAADPRPAGGTRAAAARTQLARLAPAYGLRGDDVDAARVTSVHDTGGVVIVALEQRVDGIPVFRDRLNVAMTQGGGLIGVTGYLPRAQGDTTFALDARAAVTRAAEDLLGTADPVAAGRAGAYETFALDRGTARAKRVMYHLPTGLMPGYYVEVEAGQELEAYVIAAGDGRVLSRYSLVSDAEPAADSAGTSFAYRVWADPASARPLDGPQGNAFSPHPAGVPNGLDPPMTAPALVSLANGPISTGDPWLPAAATQTQGNNVDAYADLTAPDGFTPGTQDRRGSLTSPGTFDHPYDFAVQPGASADQTEASVTQLFYTANYLHDRFYDAGFDEASGNAQNDNFGRGGAGGDALRMESLDNGGTNNANMSTPADGAFPRGQFFIWDGPAPRVSVNSPANIAGNSRGGVAAFGPQVFDLTANAAAATDAIAPTGDGCSAITSPVVGRIAIVERGTCAFPVKATNAQAAGAIGVIIVENTNASNPPPIGGSAPAVTIPVTSLTRARGTEILNALATTTVNLTLVRRPSVDSALDAQIVSHEWGHYLSARLVPGLNSTMAGGLGEGWGDAVAMLMTVGAEDAVTDFAGAYGSGAFAYSQDANSYYFGDRRLPYSTDFTKNALTFRHIADSETLPAIPLNANGLPNSEVHNTGEVWATMLWEAYAALLRDHDRLSFTQAQDRWRGYLVESLKLTPPNPTLIEARDALLMAAAARDSADLQLFWQAFARRGAGVGAVAPDRDSPGNAGVVESYELGGALVFERAVLTDALETCDGTDGFLDGGERGRLEVTVRNVGSVPLTNASTTVTSPDSAVQILDSQVSFPTVPRFGTSTAVVGVKLAPGTPGIRTARFSIGFGDPAAVGGPGIGTLDVRAGADVVPESTATDDVEAPQLDMDVRRRDRRRTWTRPHTLDPYNTYWHIDDFSGRSDVRLTSPALPVGPGPLTLSFRHRYRFEDTWDGGVVELSDDGGTTWTDIGEGYNAVLQTGSESPIADRQAYTGESAGYPDFAPRTIALGTTYAGKTIRVRFRSGTDLATGDTGWDVDDIAFTGLTSTPFARFTADPGCATITASASQTSVPADGHTTFAVTAAVKDGAGTAKAGRLVAFSSDDPGQLIGPAADNGDGSYTATVTASSAVGTTVITATDTTRKTPISATVTVAQTAIAGATAPTPTTSPPSVATPAPLTLQGVGFKPAKFKAKKGSQLQLVLSRAAALRIDVVRVRPGRRAKGKCRPSAKAGKRCTLRTPVKTLRQAGVAGRNTVAFRINRLAPGRYEATVIATAGAGTARAKAGFSIVR